MADFDLAALGQWSPVEEMLVEAEATKAYAVATNDDHPLHLSGKLAPPVFAVVPARPSFGWAISRITPPEVLLRVVHLAHDLRIDRPIVPGARLATTAAAVGVHPRPSGTVVVVRSQTHQAGELVNEQHLSLFFRGVTGG
ncbi:MAG: FAS1-like dehydratase domain-containing protein, partial [Acidimicrobiia bacterium]